MRTFENGNVTLVEEDEGVFTLYVADDASPVALQEVALLPEELDRIVEVIHRYKSIHKS